MHACTRTHTHTRTHTRTHTHARTHTHTHTHARAQAHTHTRMHAHTHTHTHTHTHARTHTPSQLQSLTHYTHITISSMMKPSISDVDEKMTGICTPSNDLHIRNDHTTHTIQHTSTMSYRAGPVYSGHLPFPCPHMMPISTQRCATTVQVQAIWNRLDKGHRSLLNRFSFNENHCWHE